MQNSAVVPMFPFDDQLKEEVYKQYMTKNVTPLQLSRKFKVPLPTIKKWEKDNEWREEKANKELENGRQLLNKLNLVSAEQVPIESHLLLQELLKKLKEVIGVKLNSNSISTMQEVVDLINRVLKIDDAIMTSLKLRK